jgi:uncharacterized protein (DUF1810 family)
MDGPDATRGDPGARTGSDATRDARATFVLAQFAAMGASPRALRYERRRLRDDPAYAREWLHLEAWCPAWTGTVREPTG